MSSHDRACPSSRGLSARWACSIACRQASSAAAVEPGEVPGAGETQFVSEPGEGLNCLRGDSGGLFLAAAHPDLHGGASEARLPLQALVAGRARRLDRLPEDGIGL